MNYQPTELVKIAKRVNNSRRSHLLVNTLQAKHIPVSPTQAFALFHKLSCVIPFDDSTRYGVVAFAETATAIGAAIASQIGKRCEFIHTTRERLGNIQSISFTEDHSHAVNHAIPKAALEQMLRTIDTLLIIDDEYTTGKTLVHAVEAMKRELEIDVFPDVFALSIVNRMDKLDYNRAAQSGIQFNSLLVLQPGDLEKAQNEIAVSQASIPTKQANMQVEVVDLRGVVSNPRFGVNGDTYKAACQMIADRFIEDCGSLIDRDSNVLVLGTEECMYPSLVVGLNLEERTHAQVCAHSTTRSPIGISKCDGYPICNGVALASFYDMDRRTYLYNLAFYDCVVLVTDAQGDFSCALADLTSALSQYGCKALVVVGI